MGWDEVGGPVPALHLALAALDALIRRPRLRT
jgi:hypothetical protein